MDFRAYDSVEAATDVVDLMQALGYRSYDLYGVSYGTRVALTLVRDWPHRVHAVVLDSTAPPSRESALLAPRTFQRALDKMARDCDEQPDCVAAYGSVRLMFDRVVRQLIMKPAIIRGSSGYPPESYVGYAEFIRGSFRSLYSTNAVASFPRFLAQIEGGSTRGLPELAVLANSTASGIAEAAEIAVNCNERLPLLDEAAVRDAATGVDPEFLQANLGITNVASLRGAISQCEEWVQAHPAAKEGESGNSDVPSLLLAGYYDPVTPPDWAYAAAETLTHSSVVEFPATSHGVLGARTGCASQLMASFLDDVTRPVNADCARAIPPPQFEPPAGH